MSFRIFIQAIFTLAIVTRFEICNAVNLIKSQQESITYDEQFV